YLYITMFVNNHLTFMITSFYKHYIGIRLSNYFTHVRFSNFNMILMLDPDLENVIRVNTAIHQRFGHTFGNCASNIRGKLAVVNFDLFAGKLHNRIHFTLYLLDKLNDFLIYKVRFGKPFMLKSF